MKLSRASSLIDKFGWWAGAGIYLRLKRNRLTGIRLPGIAFPFTLRGGTSDTAVFEQVFIKGEYDIDIPFSPSVIVDAGANIGLFSILMKSRFPAARIVCVEPGLQNCDQLKKNLAPYEGIDIVCAGIWSADIRLRLSDKFGGGESAWIAEPDGNGDTTGISMASLMAMTNVQRIDILKIDIEGSERALFLENCEQWLPKVKMIIIELHDWMIPGCSKPFFDAIHRCIPNYSYQVSGENTIIINNDIS